MIADRFDRYLARNVLGAILVVQVVLLGLDLMITYINDLDDIEGDYGALEVLVYLVMRLPWRFYQYAPVAVLIVVLNSTGVLDWLTTEWGL
jgi:lipopolysaccharide export system permease protein